MSEPAKKLDKKSKSGAKKAEEKGAKTKTLKRKSGLKNNSGVAARSKSAKQSAGVRVVGIGASAGSLKPLETLFDGMPLDTDAAFVIVQHLSPDFRSMMGELLARHSSLLIEIIADGMKVSPNTVFLNPPRSEITISDGVFTLRPSAPEVAVNLPIDAFFSSLAEEYGKESIAVVVSGSGSDGSNGAKDVHDAGGLVLAQEPSSAKFDSMPQSAMDLGVVDAVGDPTQLSQMLVSHLAGRLIKPEKGEGEPQTPTEKLFRVLRGRYGLDFSYYKNPTISRRIQRRVDLSKYSLLADYIDSLDDDLNELEDLYADMLVCVTQFFRDKSAYDSLDEKAISKLVDIMSPERQIRIWSAGCATGEEPYSLAIAFAEAAASVNEKLNLKILATDLHPHSLKAASLGIYTADSLAKVTESIRDKYFTFDGSFYTVVPSIRRLVVFSPHNVMKDPPFTRIDLLVCRNLLIYLDDVAQSKVLALFHFSLMKDSFMFLGPSETLGKISSEFEVDDARWRIFRKKRNVRLSQATQYLPPGTHYSASERAKSDDRAGFTLPVSGNFPTAASRRTLNAAYDEVLNRYAPTSLLMEKNGSLVHVFGQGGEFVDIRSGAFSNKATDLVHTDVKIPLSAALERVSSSNDGEHQRTVIVKKRDGSQSKVKMRVELLDRGSFAGEYVLVTLSEEVVPQSIDQVDIAQTEFTPDLIEGIKSRVSELERDLAHTEESLQTTIEELETSNEELQATNEELMASNEELQSTNEELHSVNEELFTVSAEHQHKIEELTELNNDMDHLLKGTEVGTVFLDANKCVRRFTPASTKLFNLMPQDIGRPFGHVTFKFSGVNIENDVDQLLKTGEPIEHEISVDNAHFLLRMLSFSGDSTSTAGLLITIFDITQLNITKQRLAASKRTFQNLYSRTPAMMHSIDQEGKLTEVSEFWLQNLGYKRDEVLGRKSVEFLTRESQEESAANLESFWKTGQMDKVPYTFIKKDGSNIEVEMSAVKVPDGDDAHVSLAVVTDVTERNSNQSELLEQNNQLEIANEELRRYALVASHDLKEPLRKIQNYADILVHEAGDQLNEDACFALKVISEASNRLSSLVGALLAYARSTRVEIDSQPVSLSTTVSNVLSDLGLEVEEVGATVNIGQLPIVSGDPHLIHQVIQNSVSNSLKYKSDTRTPKIGITFKMPSDSDGGRLTISDNGIGFDPENSLKAFEPFVRLHDRAIHFGSGIGLAIAKTIVDRHGWQIFADSTVDVGTQIHITIPNSEIISK